MQQTVAITSDSAHSPLDLPAPAEARTKYSGSHSEDRLSGGAPEPARTGTYQPAVHTSSQLRGQCHHIRNFKLATVGVLTPQELVNAANQGFFFFNPEIQLMVFLGKMCAGEASRCSLRNGGK